MGLRFRKSITLGKGVRLNFGLNGVSLSAGIPGFRKTISSNGTVTTSVGIPGTGLYYADSQKIGSSSTASRSAGSGTGTAAASEVKRTQSVPQINEETIHAIHKTCDDTIDWTEVLASPNPPEPGYNAEMWQYYHSVASSVLSGDIDVYLQLIYEINPLDDLLDYAGSFEFGTDDPSMIEVEFVVNEAPLADLRSQNTNVGYNMIFQDYVCSICLRVARDMLALLPVSKVQVHCVKEGQTIVSASFDRATMNTIRFGFIDSSDTMSRFTHHMDFSTIRGFLPVERLES